MKRLALLLLLALPAFAAPEKWFEAYDRGVTAVNAKNYKVAADALQRAIAEMPNEGTGLRAKNSLITYVPHFWLGIAKFNLGDVDGALREWRISDEQGVLARTDYYASMKNWVARAQNEKVRLAQAAASGSKKGADTAISKALEMQLEALSAGGDRAESYLAAQRKLQDARTQFQKAGTDQNAYRAAEQTAGQARALFATALEEGRKIRAARAAAPPPVKKVQPAPVQQARVIPTPAPPVQTATAPPVTVAPPPAPVVVPPPAAAPVITAAEADKRIAEQEQKRRVIETPKAPVTAISDLRPAYRAFAQGDLATSERLLSNILATQPSAEALLLRGCARYTNAVLTRGGDTQMRGAAGDIRAALAMDRSLRLDPRVFSPKLIAFFEDVRAQR
jgi:tetratricopeptide (TPR) repeat protein